jgi:hypothetical protein
MGTIRQPRGKTMVKQWDRTWVRHRYFLSRKPSRAMEKQWANNEITMGTLFGSRQHGKPMGDNGRTMGKQWENNESYGSAIISDNMG